MTYYINISKKRRRSLNLNFKLNNLSKGFVEGFRFFCELTGFDHEVEFTDGSSINPSLNYSVDNNNKNNNNILMYSHTDNIGISKFMNDVNQYNRHYIEFIGNTTFLGRYHVIVFYNGVEYIISFDDPAILDGIQTLKSWKMNDMIDSFRILSIHNNYQLCHYYINYNFQPDYKPIEIILNDYVINDLSKVIIEYSRSICQGYNKYGDIYSDKFIHCETFCEIGAVYCDVCKPRSLCEDNLGRYFPYIAKTRLELASN